MSVTQAIERVTVNDGRKKLKPVPLQFRVFACGVELVEMAASPKATRVGFIRKLSGSKGRTMGGTSPGNPYAADAALQGRTRVPRNEISQCEFYADDPSHFGTLCVATCWPCFDLWCDCEDSDLFVGLFRVRTHAASCPTI